MVAKTLSDLSLKIMQTFIPQKDREPILQFSGDFNLSGEEFLDGYYIILGTRDEQNPIPHPLPELSPLLSQSAY